MDKNDSRPLKRLAPVNNGRAVNDEGVAYTDYICPCCGNPVTRRHNKYTCGACRQALAWPGADYSEYDAELAARRKGGRAP